MLLDPLLTARTALQPPMCRWMPDGDPRGVVLGLHAFADFRAGFQEVGPWLAARGHAVVAYDLAGSGENGMRGRFPGTDTLVEELAAVTTGLRLDPVLQGLPMILMGESAGASLALAAVGRGRVTPDAMVLASPGVRKDVFARPFWDAIIFGAEAVAPAASVSIKRDDPRLSRTARRRLTSDGRVVRDVRADTYAGIVRMADEASARAPDVRCPCLILHGRDDKLIVLPSVEALVSDLGADTTLRVYDGLGHLVLQARDPDAVWNDIADFLDRVIGP